ncbi:YcxB family protein [Streptacidiphilus melanogenes]|uniref:YcxB family protein n=1 Tax=Streptacidiphilus melanogenes TaxID=411235 RepID=UPI0005A9A382|nr:YcxB family protein [Streptacidiphilus melanogenes]
MKIGVSFQLRFEEYRQAIRLLSRGRLSLWYAVVGFVLLGTVLFALGQRTQVFGVMCWAGAVLDVLLLGYGRMQLRKRFAVAGKPTEMVFEEGHFVSETNHARTEVRWTGVTDVLDTQELILLYRAKRVAHIVPTRAFSSDQLSEFRAFIASRTQPEAPAAVNS